MPSQDHYQVLGVDQRAALPDIEEAFRHLALKWHPDKNITNPETAAAQFQAV